ncbi:MAG: dUTP diphosphatase [Candidatus Bathyarchaeota archaeon]|nr:dUTP diphosphatase [Candidatus Termiticorpusculum sp.]
MFVVKFKKTDSKAITPKSAHEGDAGLDLCSIEQKTLNPKEFGLIRTGICIQLPSDTEAQIRPRSGLALNYGVTVLNTPGTIDESYRGEIGVILINNGDEPFEISVGMKIAQIVIKPTFKTIFEETAVFSESERGERGFGSTGG